MTANINLTELEADPRLFLYTSLTAGSSHIITATSRLETILKANKIPFQAIDIATDEKARRLWQRRAGKRKLPGLVKEGFVLGDLEEVEEWNEFGELRENIGSVPANNTVPPGGQTGVNIAPPLPVNPTATGDTARITPGSVNKAPAPVLDEANMRPLPGAAEIATRNASKGESAAIDTPPKVETMTSAPAQKSESLNVAKEIAKHHPALDHLSAPASRIQSGTATPNPGSIPDTAGSAIEINTAATSSAPTAAPASQGVEGAAAGTHRGSEVKEAQPGEIKKLETQTVVPETAEEDDSAATKLEGLQVGDGETTQEQGAKIAEDAGKSVED